MRKKKTILKSIAVNDATDLKVAANFRRIYNLVAIIILGSVAINNRNSNQYYLTSMRSLLINKYEHPKLEFILI